MRVEPRVRGRKPRMLFGGFGCVDGFEQLAVVSVCTNRHARAVFSNSPRFGIRTFTRVAQLAIESIMVRVELLILEIELAVISVGHGLAPPALIDVWPVQQPFSETNLYTSGCGIDAV